MFRRALRLGSRVSVASAAAVIPATAAACLSDSERRLQERLRLQGGPSVEDYLKARDAIEPERRVIVVVGITGAGKSSTANTIRGSRAKEFEVADSLSSVTRAAAFRDFAVNTGGPGANVGYHRALHATADKEDLDKVQKMMQEKESVLFRVIDTPGLHDTNLGPESIKLEYEQLAKMAPHGVSAFVVCVPHGRFTQEQEETLKDLVTILCGNQPVTIFGHGLVQHAVVAVTHAMEKNKRLLDRTELFDEISKLPPKAFLRRFVEDASDRVVGVENRLEPHRTQSTRRLHQAVLECLATNDSTYKFKPSVALKRHQSLNELDVQDDDVALADASEQVPANDPAENAVAVAVN